MRKQRGEGGGGEILCVFSQKHSVFLFHSFFILNFYSLRLRPFCKIRAILRVCLPADASCAHRAGCCAVCGIFLLVPVCLVALNYVPPPAPVIASRLYRHLRGPDSSRILMGCAALSRLMNNARAGVTGRSADRLGPRSTRGVGERSPAAARPPGSVCVSTSLRNRIRRLRIRQRGGGGLRQENFRRLNKIKRDQQEKTTK